MSSARAVSVASTNRLDTEDFVVPRLLCSTALPTGSRPAR